MILPVPESSNVLRLGDQCTENQPWLSIDLAVASAFGSRCQSWAGGLHMTDSNDTRKAGGEGYFLNSGVLYGIAIDAYRRARDRDTDGNEYHGSDAFVAIVFAAISIEAFVNEIIVNDRFGDLFGRHDVAILARTLKLLAPDTSVAKKYQIIHLMLTGYPCAEGQRPYQDFSVLMTLRNWIVHTKPEPLNCSAATKHLENRQILKPRTAKVVESQVLRIGTVAVARWACNTAADVTHAIAQLFRPASDLEEQLFQVYFQGFARIEDIEAKNPADEA